VQQLHCRQEQLLPFLQLWELATGSSSNACSSI
jgi:hypothetical protein